MKRKLLLLFASVLLPILSFAQEDNTEQGIDQMIDAAFKPISDFFSNVIFFQIGGVPFVLMLLVFAALFFTIVFGFINIRKFGTAINVVRGKYDHVDKAVADPNAQVNMDGGDLVDTIADESKDGEVTHFQALATAVSGTVGNGNIAGVALAIA